MLVSTEKTAKHFVLTKKHSEATVFHLYLLDGLMTLPF